MKQHYIDEKTGITYTLQGDYYLPNLILPAEETKYIGIWGQRHKRYLQKYKRVTYTTLLTSGKLDSYLVDIDEQAEDLFFRLVRQMAECEGVTEQLKETEQMTWVKEMNSIHNRVMEIVYAKIIYA